jgi:hypothetical protein
MAKRMMNFVIAALALVVNMSLILCSQNEKPSGTYTVLFFVALLFAYDTIRHVAGGGGWHRIDARRRDGGGGNDQTCIGRGGDPRTHTHAPTQQNALYVYIGVWLAWWAVTQAFYNADYHFIFTWPLMLVMLTIVLVVSVSSTAVTHSLAVDLFLPIFLIVLALPSKDWMPQYMTWVRDELRVLFYFTAVFVADYLVERPSVSEQSVADLVEREQQLSAASSATNASTRRDDATAADAADLVCATYFCATIERYEAVQYAEHRRTKVIVALSAWVLVVSKHVILYFAALLALVHLILYWQRRRLQSAAAAAAAATTTTTATMPLSSSVPRTNSRDVNDVAASSSTPPQTTAIPIDDDYDDGASVSGDTVSGETDEEAPAPPPPLASLQRGRSSNGNGVRTQTIFL